MTDQKAEALATADRQEYNLLRELEADTEKLMIRYRHLDAKRRYEEAKWLSEKAQRTRSWSNGTVRADVAWLFGLVCGGVFGWLFL